MLISLSVENYRSFLKEQTLSLLASKRLGPAPTFQSRSIPGTDESVLRIISLYGPNASGKSNLVRALNTLQQLVLNGTAPEQRLPHSPFRLTADSEREPTSIEIQFLEDGHVYRYGVCFDSNRVFEEWLSYYDRERECNLFSRESTPDGVVAVELGPAVRKNPPSDKIEPLSKVGARANELFLTKVLALGNAKDQGSHFRRAVDWFTKRLVIVPASARYTRLAQALSGDNDFGKFSARFLRDASTGIDDLRVETQEIPASNLGPGSEFQAGLPTQKLSIIDAEDGTEYFVDASGGDKVRFHSIRAIHNRACGEPVSFPLHEESDGSRRLLHLLPALFLLEAQGGVFVVDELERSMHPMLARKFIQFFSNGARDGEGQLIFTTHETTLLDLDLLRRDGIWFVEKDETGTSQVYSLADFRVRKDLRIEKGYLAGRFGAIPSLGGIDRQMEQYHSTESPP